MDKIFVDSNICMDFLIERTPFYEPAVKLFSLAHDGKIQLGVSANSIVNIDYLLINLISSKESRQLLNRFITIVRIVTINENIIKLALTSAFTDFEDAVQYYTAIENGYSIILTRNLRDYKKAEIPVMAAEDYVKGLRV